MQTGSQFPELEPIRGGAWTREELRDALQYEEVDCVRFAYCVSLIFVTFRYQSPVYVFQNPTNQLLYGLFYSMVSLAFGIWGLPWGPIWTGHSIWVNLRGGLPAQPEVLSWLKAKSQEN
jgi:hypothetical protein